ncbi:MAG TPA: type II toxin-antitoxin system death-on-curing family toxin [Burkholderiales bacterium]|jgi:death-on-curing protein
MRHLTVDAVLAIHEQVLEAHGGGPGIRDKALLESAVAAPQASYAGTPVFTDPMEIAAAYFFYLCRNHPFVDGNKRAGLAACLVFLQLNDLLDDPELPGRAIDAWETFVLDIAASRLDREQTTRRLRSLLDHSGA